MAAFDAAYLVQCLQCETEFRLPLTLTLPARGQAPAVPGQIAGELSIDLAPVHDHVDEHLGVSGGRRPVLGDVVHYQAYGSADGRYASVCRAALVTEVGQWVTARTEVDDDGATRTVHQVWDAEAVACTVHNPTGTFHNTECRHSEGRCRGGTWHWPEQPPGNLPPLVQEELRRELLRQRHDAPRLT